MNSENITLNVWHALLTKNHKSVFYKLMFFILLGAKRTKQEKRSLSNVFAYGIINSLLKSLQGFEIF